jgi:Mn2+/Fe2+ NRAMP family transporter
MRTGSKWARWGASLGPGLVFALTVAGPGSFVSNAAAGATYGYSLIWALGFTVVFRYAWLSTSAKYVLVTGDTVLDGYRRIGRWLAWLVLGAAVAVRHLSNMYKVLLLGGCVQLLLPLPVAWGAKVWALISVLLAFTMTFWGGYPLVERFCRILVALMTASLAIAAFLSHPDPGALARALLIPGFPTYQGAFPALLLVMALIGTEAGSLTNLTYTYFLNAKGWKTVDDLPRQRIDLFSSIACILILGTMVQIAAAATVHPLGLKLKTAGDLMKIFSESLGLAGRLIFGAGMWASAFSGFVGGTTGYALMVTDILRGGAKGVHAPSSRRPDPGKLRDPIFRGMVAFWCFSPLYVLFTSWEPVYLVLVLNSVMVWLVPVLALALLRLTNDSRRMGKYVNGWLTNLVLGVLVAVSVWLIVRNAL